MKSKTKPTVAITGASGFLGSALVSHFLNKSWRVVALSRKPLKINNQNFEFREYDLDKNLDAATLKGVDYVVHAAYVKKSTNSNALDVNVVGAEKLISAIKNSNVRQTIFISSMSAHEEAISIYGIQKLRLEGMFSKLPRVAVLRPGLIIGNGGIVKDIANIMRRYRIVPVIGGGKQPLQIIAIDDLVQAIGNILDKSLSGKFVVATTKVYKYIDFYKALSKHLGIKVVCAPIPYWMLSVTFKTLSALRINLGIGDDNLKGLKKLTAMNSRQSLDKIGIQAANLEEALARTKTLGA